MENTEQLPTYDFFALGEAVVDFISTDLAHSLNESATFQRFIGGQATNLCMNMTRLGKHAALATCVGYDGLGNYIRQELDKAGLEGPFIQTTREAPTTIVTLTRQTHTPEFIVHRGADTYLRPSTELTQAVSNTKLLHTSVFALSREPTRTTVLSAIKSAKESGARISLDPNYHPNIWPDIHNLKDLLQEAIASVDFIKPSLDDCTRLFGPRNKPLEYASIFLEWGAQIVLISMGERGVFLATNTGETYHVLANPNTVVADVTGAGDAYWAGFLAATLNGSDPLESACVGQIMAEIKISQIGPITQTIDYSELIERAKSVTYKQITN